MKRALRLFGAGGRFVARVIARYNEHEGGVLAGHIAYSGMLSLMPFLIFATALAGFVVGDEGTQAALSMMFEALPPHVAQTLEPVILEVTGRRRGDILTIAFLGAIWAASNGVEAVRIALDKAYEGDLQRRFGLNRAVSIVVVIASFATFILLGLLIVIAPLAFRLVESYTGIVIPAAADYARYAVSAGVMAVFLWYLHRLLPTRRLKQCRLWPGILATMVVWGVAGTLLSQYLAFAPSYAVTYGTLGGVVVTLLFFYLTGVAIILGAEVNAVVNAARLHTHGAGGEDDELGILDKSETAEG